MAKTKLIVNNGKTPPKAKLGASSSTAKSPSPLLALGKKSAKKTGSDPEQFGMAGFGDTGMTGES